MRPAPTSLSACPRPSRTRSVGALAALALIVTGAATGAVAPDPANGAVGRVAPVADQSQHVPTTVRVGSFNLLGHSHTASGGKRKGWASGIVRMHWTVDLLRDHQLQVVGFQEMQQPQFETFRALTQGEFGLYPGNRRGTAALANSIAWRRDIWQLVKARTTMVPYFDGNPIAMPYVKLRNRTTGRNIWVYNSHNPADTRGPAQKWRDAGVRLEVELVKRLQEESPGVPIIITGDKNDRDEYFCPVTATTGLHAANGGSHTAEVCDPPAQMKVDWVMGNSAVTFTSYQALQTELVAKTTDHPVIVADAVLPTQAVVAANVRHVVVVSVSGLRSRAISRLAAKGAPVLTRLMKAGASTLDARPAHERVGWLANTVSLLTGARVSARQGGHGVGTGRDHGGVVHASAGRYVSSVFDVVHNYGRRTTLVAADPRISRIDKSWNERTGVVASYGRDTSADKITEYVGVDDDAAAVTALRDRASGRLGALTVATLSSVRDAGLRYGWRSERYLSAVTKVDRLLGGLVEDLADNPRSADDTMLVVTSERGGAGRGSDSRSTPGFYRVPLIVTGPTVPAGADLYQLNPQYTDPRNTNPGYRAFQQPIRVAYVANLVTKVLRLPTVPGSDMDGKQTLTATVDG